MSNDAFAVDVVTDNGVADFISSARERVIFVAPALSVAVARALCRQWRVLGRDRVAVIVDTDPEVYRLGYGEQAGLDALASFVEETGATLRRQPGIRICIVIVDAKTLVYAPTPQLIEAGPNTNGGANALFLGPPPPALERDLGSNDHPPRLGAGKLTAGNVESIKSDLKENPPQRFDIARRMNVFNSYYEFVERELLGVRIDRKRIRIPRHLLGVADKKTRDQISSHFQLCADGSALSGEQLRKDRDLISRRYLTLIKHYGCVVKRAEKPKLVAEVEGLRERVSEFSATLAQELQDSIDQSRGDLFEALLPAVLKTPPEEWCSSSGRRPDEAACRKFLQQDLKAAFGRAERLLSGMTVDLKFKGITFETLNDREFLVAADKAGLDVSRLHEEFEAARASEKTRALPASRSWSESCGAWSRLQAGQSVLALWRGAKRYQLSPGFRPVRGPRLAGRGAPSSSPGYRRAPVRTNACFCAACDTPRAEWAMRHPRVRASPVGRPLRPPAASHRRSTR